MKVLLTGATGYIGKRLLPVLLSEGHEVYCCVRDKERFNTEKFNTTLLRVIEVNFLDKSTLENIPDEIDAAYYLIHSMSGSIDHFEELEKRCAENFMERMNFTTVKQVIYLSGIINNKILSRHLLSRKAVEDILAKGKYKLTTLRAGIILGSGSASFEIIRDLVEKLPVMVAPRWLNTRSQPIAIRDILRYLQAVLFNRQAYGKSFDIGGPEILTYKEMLLKFSSVRNLKRRIFIIPVMTPKLSSYWLYFITSISYKLAVNLVNSMKVEIVCADNSIREIIDFPLTTYEEAVKEAFGKIEQEDVLSSWTDALSGSSLDKGIAGVISIPELGCFTDKRTREIEDEDVAMNRIWSIGGKNGWYYANWLWKFRGFLDKVFGGVGLRRGRKSQHEIHPGDALDFWRVLYASKQEKRLLLYAEMKLPGEAWLEFLIKDGILIQTATFRPLGLWGRLYWYAVMPLHGIIFSGMIRRIGR